jgi:hypothetical protein
MGCTCLPLRKEVGLEEGLTLFLDLSFLSKRHHRDEGECNQVHKKLFHRQIFF